MCGGEEGRPRGLGEESVLGVERDSVHGTYACPGPGAVADYGPKVLLLSDCQSQRAEGPCGVDERGGVAVSEQLLFMEFVVRQRDGCDLVAQRVQGPPWDDEVGGCFHVRDHMADADADAGVSRWRGEGEGFRGKDEERGEKTCPDRRGGCCAFCVSS